jgi:hypothetical protein
MDTNEEVKKKFTPAYAEYMKYLEEVVFADEIKEIKEKEAADAIQEVLPRKS